MLFCVSMIDPHSLFLISAAFVVVVGLIVLIAVFKLNPFITLFLTSLALAVVTGMPFSTVVHSFEAGVGATLEHCNCCGARNDAGKDDAESGGADRIAHTLIRFFGEKRVHWP